MLGYIAYWQNEKLRKLDRKQTKELADARKEFEAKLQEERKEFDAYLHESRKVFDAKLIATKEWKEATKPIIKTLVEQLKDIEYGKIGTIKETEFAYLLGELPDNLATKQAFTDLVVEYAVAIKDAGPECDDFGQMISPPDESYSTQEREITKCNFSVA
ncbi:hypothetical protein ACFL00_02825 [Pseudomonadota bacterium]